MILSEQKYYAERGKSSETYQIFTATVEINNNRQYVTIAPDFLQRWRSKTELADYLRWMADEVEKLPVKCG